MGEIAVRDSLLELSIPEKLLLFLLFIAVCIVLVRMIKLTWQIWSFQKKQEFPSKSSNVEAIAKAVLKGTFKREPINVHGESVQQTDCVDSRFFYLWETCHAKIQSTKTLAALTAILAFFVAVLGCIEFYNFSVFIILHPEAHATGIDLWGKISLLAIGLFVSALFYTISLLFEETLARRRRDWNYLKARIKEEFDSKELQCDDLLENQVQK